MFKPKLTFILLFCGVVLLSMGIFGQLGFAAPVPPQGTPGDTLQIKHTIAYQHIYQECGQGCQLTREPPKPFGTYLGGFMGSWRNCSDWTAPYVAAPPLVDPEIAGHTYVKCVEPGGTLVSAFGVLARKPNGKLVVLFPLKGTDIQNRINQHYIPADANAVVPDDWEEEMLWTVWDIKVETAIGQPGDPAAGNRNYTYTWAGYLGGGCSTGSEVPGDLCGRVSLEHDYVLPESLTPD